MAPKGARASRHPSNRPVGWNREIGGHKSRRFAGPAIRAYLLEHGDFRCGYCGEPITNDTANIDHVKPWKYGGTTRPKNLVAACHACNKAKCNMGISTFYLMHGPFRDQRLNKKAERIVRKYNLRHNPPYASFRVGEKVLSKNRRMEEPQR